MFHNLFIKLVKNMLTHKSFVKKAETIFRTAPEDGQVLLFYMDFAEFKLVNRYYGIKQGNDLLAATEVYLGQIPEVAAYARLFSDQFIFIVVTERALTKQEMIDAYARYAEDFLSRWRNRYSACNLRTYCGIYLVRNGNVLESLDNVNMAWHEAKKKQVPGTVVFDQSMLDELTAYQKEEREVNLALQENRFVFYLQPKVDLATGLISGAEALARRVDTDGAVVGPDAFLPVMEKNGSVVELDYLIQRKVCKHMMERLFRGLPVVKTSINLSRLHIQAQDSASKLHAIAQEYGVPPHLLEFELTETILLNEFSGAKRLCDQLRGYGYAVSIDDFGAGYAGVNILQELDFDVLKLDRKFLSNEEPLKSRNWVILPGFVHSLHKLKISTICEGVETAEQCRYLKRIGCGFAQGYYFSRPVSPEQFYNLYQTVGGRYPLPISEPTAINS